jgi:hypothetical protein
MHMRYLWFNLAPVLLSTLAVIPGSGQEIPSRFFRSDETLDQRVRAVLPKPGEDAWKQVHWYTDLNVARAEAQRTNKPIFLWIMDGHPLCGT